MAGEYSWLFADEIMNRLEKGAIKIGDLPGTKLLQGMNGSLQVLSELTHRDAPASFRPGLQ
jgi:hypothetical protein